MSNKGFWNRKDYPANLAVGQLSFVFGILITRLLDNTYALKMVERAIGEFTLVHFLEGFLDGVGMVLIILSIIFNLKGLTLYRSTRFSTPNGN